MKFVKSAFAPITVPTLTAHLHLPCQIAQAFRASGKYNCRRFVLFDGTSGVRTVGGMRRCPKFPLRFTTFGSCPPDSRFFPYSLSAVQEFFFVIHLQGDFFTLNWRTSSLKTAFSYDIIVTEQDPVQFRKDWL